MTHARARPAAHAGGTARAHPHAHTLAHPGRPASATTSAAAGAPRPRPGRHAGSAPRAAPRSARHSLGEPRRRRLSHAPESPLQAETHSFAVLVSEAPRAQRRQLAAHLFHRCLGSAYYVPGGGHIGGRGRQEPLDLCVYSAGLYRAPAVRQVLPPVCPRGPVTEKTDIKRINWKHGRQEREQRESKVTPNTTSLMTLRGLSFQLWETKLLLPF